MANRYRNLIYSTAEYTHSYRGFRGVELNASEATTSQARLAYSQNMYKNYDADGAEVIESIPGYRKILDTYGEVRNLFSYKNEKGESRLVIHSGERLFRLPLSELDSGNTLVYSSVNDGKSDSFFSGGRLFVIDGFDRHFDDLCMGFMKYDKHIHFILKS